MKQRFHFLIFYCCLVSLLGFSIKEMPNTVTGSSKEKVLEHQDSKNKDSKEKESRKKEEENEEENLKEDPEIEDQFSEYALNLATTNKHFESINARLQKLLQPYFNPLVTKLSYNLPPFYILFVRLKINCLRF